MTLALGRSFLRSLVFTFDGVAIESPSVTSSHRSVLAMFCSAASPKHSRKGQRGDHPPRARRRKGSGKQQQQQQQRQQQQWTQRTELKQPALEISSIASQLAPKDSKSQLHDELVDFAWRCAPTPASVKLAQLSARAIELAWSKGHANRPPIRAVPFGSQPCAVALPGGDLDVYVESAEVSSACCRQYHVNICVAVGTNPARAHRPGANFVSWQHSSLIYAGRAVHEPTQAARVPARRYGEHSHVPRRVPVHQSPRAYRHRHASWRNACRYFIKGEGR